MFDNQSKNSTAIRGTSEGGVESKPVDGRDCVIPNGEVFKRKQIDVSLSKGDGCKVKLVKDDVVGSPLWMM